MSRKPLIRGFEGYVYREDIPEEQPPKVKDFRIPIRIAEDALRIKRFKLQQKIDENKLPTVIDAEGNRWAWATDVVYALKGKACRVTFASLEMVKLKLPIFG